MHPPQPSYSKITGLLYGLAGAGENWAGFLASGDTEESLTLEQAWADLGGVFLFCPTEPNNYAEFLGNLHAYLSGLGAYVRCRILWISLPDQPAATWQTQLLGALFRDGQWFLNNNTSFRLGSYQMQMLAGAALSLTSSDSDWAMQVASGQSSFWRDGNQFNSSGKTASIDFIDGRLNLGLSLAGSGAAGLQQLKVGMAYGWPDPGNSQIPGEPQQIQSLFMPVFQQGVADLQMNLFLDPLRPLETERSYLEFASIDYNNQEVKGLLSNWSSILGGNLWLAPSTSDSTFGAGRLSFGLISLYAGDMASLGEDYYLTLHGGYQVKLDKAQQSSTSRFARKLQLGLSSLEYTDVVEGCTLCFEADQAAFVPTGKPGEVPAFTDLVTTAYGFVATGSTTGASYYAQPKQAPLFNPQLQTTNSLEFHELGGQALPFEGSKPKYFPVGVYKGLLEGQGDQALQLEQAMLAPKRRQLIGNPDLGSQTVSDWSQPTAVTAQGLVAYLNEGSTDWAGLLLAQVGSGSEAQKLALTEVGDEFQAALQNNQLFLVATNPAVLMDQDSNTHEAQSSVPYQFDLALVQLLKDGGQISATEETALKGLFETGTEHSPFYWTEKSFAAAVSSLLSASAYKALRQQAGQLKVNLDGWVFQLSPRDWRNSPDTPNENSVMLVKYCNRAITELVQDPSSWSWPAVAKTTGGLLSTQQALQDYVDKTEANPSSPFQDFYKYVLNNPHWNGVLFLNAPISTRELDEDLQFITAGMDLSLFYAHHLGFSIGSLQTSGSGSDKKVDLGQSSAFGLVYYNDPTDLMLADAAYGFKTLNLTARFANSSLVDFHTLVELQVNRFFHGAVTKTPTDYGNNLRILGSLQKVGEQPIYSFVLDGENHFQQAFSALEEVTIRDLQLSTSHNAQDSNSITTSFNLAGVLKFVYLPDFDLYSFGDDPSGFSGGLNFGNLAIRMQFNKATPSQQSFVVDNGHISLDMSGSQLRPHSLVAQFPLKISGVLVNNDTTGTPDDHGFTSLLAPLDQTPLQGEWAGLQFDLELGSLGALTGSQPIKLHLLAAWAPSPSPYQQPMYVGLKLPNASGPGMDLPLQGVIRFGFKSMEFLTLQQEGNPLYMLKLNQLALRVLSMSLPPGNLDVQLLGNPQGNGQGNKLSWLAAYKKGDSGSVGSGFVAAPNRAELLRKLGGRRQVLDYQEAGHE